MNLDSPEILLYLIPPALLTMATYIARGFLVRIQLLEDKMNHTITENQVQQLLHYKYDPLAEDIREIKEMQKKLFDMVVQSIRENKDNG